MASDDLWRTLATLSARERVVLVLRYYQDLDDRTIADLLGIKPSSVRAIAEQSARRAPQGRGSPTVLMRGCREQDTIS